MVLLIDTNVLIDYLAKRPGFFDDARSIIKFCSEPGVKGYVAFHSIPNAWFILRKEPDWERREGLKAVCSILTVTGASHTSVVNAIEQTNFKDFEDCLQDKCAETVQADYVITRNVKDFTGSSTQVISPADFIHRFLIEAK